MAPPDLPISVDRASTLAHNFLRIKQRLACTPRPTSPPPSSSPSSTSRPSSPARITQRRSNDEAARSTALPILVAVSKLKPANDILFLHGRPSSSPSSSSSPPQNNISQPTPSPLPPSLHHDHFGENYTDELIAKSRILPRSIKWHFIGQLQSNKCKHLAENVENLWCVESVDSEKKADGLEKGRRAMVERKKKEREEERKNGEKQGTGREAVKNGHDQEDADKAADAIANEEQLTEAANSQNSTSLHLKSNSNPDSNSDSKEPWEVPLRICIQINTSSEPQKSGLPCFLPPTAAIALHQHITHSCPNLQVWGLMTIGALARSLSSPPPPRSEPHPSGNENTGDGDEDEDEDFIKLRQVRDAMVKELGLPKEDLKLSMGMSEDFERALGCGSDEVRVGSKIFGERVKDRKEAKVVAGEDEEGRGG